MEPGSRCPELCAAQSIASAADRHAAAMPAPQQQKHIKHIHWMSQLHEDEQENNYVNMNMSEAPAPATVVAESAPAEMAAGYQASHHRFCACECPPETLPREAGPCLTQNGYGYFFIYWHLKYQHTHFRPMIYIYIHICQIFNFSKNNSKI